ncbi:2-polyprenyl-3-methyl-5-hydroxy-6-metoxy-1,4-benzoquinol methylase [Novosphingobium sp. CF614]|uniref:class I SAM-dependent methyltransferase n=1 Tax=Novosphingobium sp. CF614 TaxID=1884364 RepID=UPI0008ED28F5|nr:methyltransferase domain-containing protein [Novosphingobium sp. CF614]SFG19618.1 2-polyprenyl-3-methyl-5-hydroxy-6-metoxy-1,4-benzoquinol methylase [Novosphingobium sp. CF614]
MDIDININSTDIKNFLQRVTFPLEQQEGARRYHDIHSERYAITIKAMAKLPLSLDMRVLELAAEPYGMSAWLAKHFCNLTLANYADTPVHREVEILVEGRRYQLTEHGFNVEHDTWPLPEESFDLVMACEIVEHLAMDPMAMFAGANRIIKPGGYFFVSTPNAASIQNILKLGRLVPAGLAQHFRRPLSRLYERHNREYNPFTIGEMMRAGGFEIFIMETDSAFPLFDLDYDTGQINDILAAIGMPELRRDTINVIGRKVSGVVERYPEAHDLYIASDATEEPTGSSVHLKG